MSKYTGISLETYFSPEQDLKQVFLDFIQGTEEHMRMCIYSIHMPALITDVKQLKEKKVDQAYVIDHSQAQGHYEHPEILELIADGIPLLQGTSTKHKIVHDKFVVRDKRYVLAGSWNFSESATDESNFFFIVDSPEMASEFLKIWQDNWDFINQNEQQYQEGK